MKYQGNNGVRKQIQQRQYERRLEIIQLLKSGKTGKETAKILQVSQSLVSSVKKAFEENGYAALAIYEKGVPWGNENISNS